MVNKKDMLNQISTEITRVPKVPLWMSERGLDDRVGQKRLSEKTSRPRKIALTGEQMNGYYRFMRNFYGLSDIPTSFREKELTKN